MEYIPDKKKKKKKSKEEEECPTLIKVFIKFGEHNDESVYATLSAVEPSARIHGCPSSTLLEVWRHTLLFRPDVRRRWYAARRRTTVSVALVYPDRDGVMTLRHCVSLNSMKSPTSSVVAEGDGDGDVGGDGTNADVLRTLQSFEYERGDFIEFALIQRTESGCGGGEGGGKMRQRTQSSKSMEASGDKTPSQSKKRKVEIVVVDSKSKNDDDDDGNSDNDNDSDSGAGIKVKVRLD